MSIIQIILYFRLQIKIKTMQVCKKVKGFFLECWENLRVTPPAQAEGSVRLLVTKKPLCSSSCPSCQVRSFLFERFSRLGQSVGPVSGPFLCAESSLGRAWNASRRLGLGPDLTESYPLLVVRKYVNVSFPIGPKKKSSTASSLNVR